MSVNPTTNSDQERGYLTERPLVSYITVGNAARVVRRVGTGMVISYAIRTGVSFFFPPAAIAGVAADVFNVVGGRGIVTDAVVTLLGGRSYDPSTCIGSYNICVDSVMPGCWGDSSAGMIGCHLAYMACVRMRGG